MLLNGRNEIPLALCFVDFDEMFMFFNKRFFTISLNPAAAVISVQLQSILRIKRLLPQHRSRLMENLETGKTRQATASAMSLAVSAFFSSPRRPNGFSTYCESPTSFGSPSDRFSPPAVRTISSRSVRTVAASEASTANKRSTLRSACRTELASLLPKHMPILAADQSVHCPTRYMDTWRGSMNRGWRSGPRISLALTLKCSATRSITRLTSKASSGTPKRS